MTKNALDYRPGRRLAGAGSYGIPVQREPLADDGETADMMRAAAEALGNAMREAGMQWARGVQAMGRTLMAEQIVARAHIGDGDGALALLAALDHTDRAALRDTCAAIVALVDGLTHTDINVGTNVGNLVPTSSAVDGVRA